MVDNIKLIFHTSLENEFNISQSNKQFNNLVQLPNNYLYNMVLINNYIKKNYYNFT